VSHLVFLKAHACNISTWEFEANLGYIARPCLKKTQETNKTPQNKNGVGRKPSVCFILDVWDVMEVFKKLVIMGSDAVLFEDRFGNLAEDVSIPQRG
jgi:hypothetical protein